MLIGHADRLDDGPARLAEEADGDPLDAEPQRPGDHADKRSCKGKVKDDPKALKPFVDEAKASGDAADLRHDVPARAPTRCGCATGSAPGGINPDKDVSLITIPPAQMVANMKVGKMDGFCVGEPWNARAIADGIGFTAITTQEIWKDHPEKVCAFTAEFADKNPKTVKAVLKALHEASVWLDNLENRPEQARDRLAADLHQLPEGDDPRPHAGPLRLRRRPQEAGPELHDLQQPQLQLPAAQVRDLVADASSAAGAWSTARPTTTGVAKQVMRPDIYEEAMKEIGVRARRRDNKPETLFDGVTFDPGRSPRSTRSRSRSTPEAEHGRKPTIARRRIADSTAACSLVGVALRGIALWALSQRDAGPRTCRRRSRPGR